MPALTPRTFAFLCLIALALVSLGIFIGAGVALSDQPPAAKSRRGGGASCTESADRGNTRHNPATGRFQVCK